MHRYKLRMVGDPTWTKGGFGIREVMRRVKALQDKHGPRYRWHRRETPWRRWWTLKRAFRVRVRVQLRSARLGVFQIQVGGANGPILAILKYRVPPPELTIGQQVIEAGKSVIGTKYAFGEANGPEDPGQDKFDCSGLTQWAWATVDVELPHSSEGQRVADNVFNFTDEAKAIDGDLVLMWFENSRGIPPNRASHVGLHYGNGRTGKVLDTRNPINSPVAIRDAAGVIGYGRPS